MMTMVGTSDEITTCDCCGKTNLKRTVVFKTDEDFVFYGVDCAAKVITKNGSKTSRSAVDTQASAVAYTQRLIAQNTYTLLQVCRAVAARYGFPTGVTGNAILIGSFAVVEA